MKNADAENLNVRFLNTFLMRQKAKQTTNKQTVCLCWSVIVCPVLSVCLSV